MPTLARLRDGRIMQDIASTTNLEFKMLIVPVRNPLILK
jgi:hypothetical protein